MAEEKELTHAQKVQRHFDIIGKPNPFKAAHSAQARAGERTGGLGSNKGAARYENTSAEDRAAANSDGRYGYFDEVNKRYVPAIFDIMDGGGFDSRGDEFKGGGPLSGILNDLGVKPYGSERERMFVNPNTSPIVQAVANPQSNVDPRVLTSRGYEPDNIAPPAATVNQQIGINDPLTFQSDQANPTTFAQRQSAEQAEQVRMAALIDEARGLAARSGLDFNTMSQERQAEFINAIRFGVGGPTSGRF